MISKPVSQQENEEMAAVVVANKKKQLAAEKKCRRALGDIGNLVCIDGKPILKASRPVTRSFCAKLIAEAAAAPENKSSLPVANDKDPILVEKPPPKKKLQSKIPGHKKVTVEPKTDEVIVISPDTALVKKPLERRKSSTFTSTLTSRSKAAVGLNELKVDIDAADANNELAVVEYVKELYNYYKATEGPTPNYIELQPDISVKMRSILIDWLVQVHCKLELSQETLYLTVNVIDRYLSLKMITRRKLQLVGLGAMLIASKYEEIWAPEVNDLVYISDQAYTNDQVLVIEKDILSALEWTLTVPTMFVFVARFLKASMTGSDVGNMAWFLAELGMMNYSCVITYKTSMIAAAAVYMARRTMSVVPLWNGILESHTGFSELELMECGKVLVRLHSCAADDKLCGIYNKYSTSERGEVALLQPVEISGKVANVA